MRRGRRRGSVGAGQGRRPEGVHRYLEAEEHHPVHRRRHGRAGSHVRPLLRQGRRGAPEHGRAQAPWRRHHLQRRAGRPAAVPAQLRAGLRPDGERLVQRHQDARRAPRPGPELRRDRAGHQLQDLHGDRARPWHGHGQRLHRRDHRRDAGRTVLAHLPARLPGPERHAHRVPDGDQGRRRPRLDRRAAGRREVRRRPRRRPRTLRAAARGRWHEERHRLRQGDRATSTWPPRTR